MNPSPEGNGLTAFYSSNLMPDIVLTFNISIPEYVRPEEDPQREFNFPDINLELRFLDLPW